jgi:hypothetical protein
MATSVMRRNEVPPAPSERLALRAARAALTEVETELATLRAEEEVEWDVSLASWQELQEIEKAIAIACPRISLTKCAGLPPVYGAAPPPPEGLAIRLATVEATRDKLRGERIKRKARIEQLEKSRAFRAEVLERAAIAVLATAPAVERVVPECEQLLLQVADRGTALNWLIARGAIYAGSSGVNMSPAAVLQARWESIAYTAHDLVRQVEGAKPYVDALTALMADPDAELPD